MQLLIAPTIYNFLLSNACTLFFPAESIAAVKRDFPSGFQKTNNYAIFVSIDINIR